MYVLVSIINIFSFQQHRKIFILQGLENTLKYPQKILLATRLLNLFIKQVKHL